MSKLHLFLFSILSGLSPFCFELQAQITDHFSDGNITANPAWQGEISEFIVNAAGELQLNAPDAGTSVLAVEGNIPDSAIWLIDIRLEFAPSASNLLRIYLLADQADLLTANGYYLEIGENNAADALRFYRQDGAARTLLSTGMPGFVANEPVNIRLRVQRQGAGSWMVSAAVAGGFFEPQGTAIDATYTGCPFRFFGIYCLYTDTRKDKFYFDSLSIQPIVPDTEPPVLVSAQADADLEVTVFFNESIDSVSALDLANYTIDGVGKPVAASFAGSCREQVNLQLAAPLSVGTHTLQTDQITDSQGNTSGVQSLSFPFVKIEAAAPFDILINEIMAAPSPSAGLPDAEWLELYNRSEKIIDLKTLRLSDGGNLQALPGYLLFPDSFIVLASPTNAAKLAPVTMLVRAMTGFPLLNNEGDVLVLRDQSGQLIDQVAYLEAWHADSKKRDGGWTLERINPELPCLGAENWQSCPVLPGGTPGLPNASLQTTPDTKPPQLLAVFPDNATTLRVFFSEGLDQFAATELVAYRIDPPLAMTGAMLSTNNRQEVLLSLAEPMEAGIVYAFTVTAVLKDCSGNSAAASDTAFFGLPETPEPLDLVINEILFNPASGGSDFVELYNRSDKFFSGQHLFLANFFGGADIKPIALDRLMLPGQYMVFSPGPADIATRFPQAIPENLHDRELPSLPDDSGNITLYWSKDGAAVTLDSFDYEDDYHNALLSSSEREGVSLERIRADGPTNDAFNWTSAARTSSGAGTPTLPNSQRSVPGANSDELFSLERPRLSPDQDGFEDFLQINYTFPATGYAATMTVYDSEGIPVKRLLRQELISTEGALRWDGDLDDGSLARPGIYILFLEIFEPGGNVQQFKKPFAVVRPF